MKRIAKCLIAFSVFAFWAQEYPTSSFAQTTASRALQSNNERIVGGEPAKQAPWAIRLNIDDGGLCGASLVQPQIVNEDQISWVSNYDKARYAISAAHCFLDRDTGEILEPSRVKAVVGRLDLSDASSGEERNVVNIILHPDFDSDTLANDVALLVLDATSTEMSLNLRSSIRPPNPGDTTWLAQNYLALYAQGWGRTTEGGATSQLLLEVRLPQVDHDHCAELFGIHGIDLHAGSLCAGFFSGGFDSCAGDSGGPLIFQPVPTAQLAPVVTATEAVLIGAVSYGIGCARQNLYGVYTSIAYHRGWLEEVSFDCLKSADLKTCGKDS